MHSFNMRDGTIHDGVFVILAGTYVMWQLQETCPDYLYTLPMWVLGITLTTLLVCKQKPSVPLPYLIKLSPAASVCVYMYVCLTLHTDAPEVSNLHQYLGEHTGFIGSPPPHIDLCTHMKAWRSITSDALISIL